MEILSGLFPLASEPISFAVVEDDAVDDDFWLLGGVSQKDGGTGNRDAGREPGARFPVKNLHVYKLIFEDGTVILIHFN